MRGTTRSGSGPVRIGPRRRHVNTAGHSRLVQRVRYSHRRWTKFRGPHTLNRVDPSGRCDLALWIIATAPCLVEKVAPAIRGTPLAAPVAAWAQTSYNAVDWAQQHTTMGASAGLGACIGLSEQGGQLALPISLPCAGVSAWTGISPFQTADQRSPYQACLAASWMFGLQVCVGTDANGNVKDWHDCEVDFVTGFGVKIPGSWGADVSHLPVWPKND